MPMNTVITLNEVVKLHLQVLQYAPKHVRMLRERKRKLLEGDRKREPCVRVPGERKLPESNPLRKGCEIESY